MFSLYALAKTSVLLCGIYLYEVIMKEKARWKFYIACFVLFYSIFALGTMVSAEEVADTSSSQNEGYVFFFGDSPFFEADKFLDCIEKSPPTRTELIMKMTEHKKSHDFALEKSEELLEQCGCWDKEIEYLYNAAKAAVATYAGCRNFILPAIVAIIDYSFEKCWHLTTMWREYNTYMLEAKYHAEMFDFYMNVLKRVYGQ